MMGKITWHPAGALIMLLTLCLAGEALGQDHYEYDRVARCGLAVPNGWRKLGNNEVPAGYPIKRFHVGWAW